MKFTGAVLLWAGMTLLGIKCSEHFKIRCDCFSRILEIIEVIKNEINYSETPVNELMRELSSEKTYSCLDFIKNCALQLDSGADFPVAWKSSVEKTSLPLKREEKNKLMLLGNALGQGTAQAQINILCLYHTYFNEYSEKALVQREKYASSSITLFCLIGSVAFIMLL